MPGVVSVPAERPRFILLGFKAVWLKVLFHLGQIVERDALRHKLFAALLEVSKLIHILPAAVFDALLLLGEHDSGRFRQSLNFKLDLLICKKSFGIAVSSFLQFSGACSE